MSGDSAEAGHRSALVLPRRIGIGTDRSPIVWEAAVYLLPADDVLRVERTADPDIEGEWVVGPTPLAYALDYFAEHPGIFGVSAA